MVVIVSNGRQYSDHRLYFVAAPSVEAVEAVMNPPDQDDPDWYPNAKAHVVGTCESLAWKMDKWHGRSGIGATMTLEAFTEEAKSYL